MCDELSLLPTALTGSEQAAGDGDALQLLFLPSVNFFYKQY